MANSLSAADLIEIHQLLGRYGHAVDDRDWTAFRALFTADATLDHTAMRMPEVLVGIEAIVAYYDGANHPSAHHVTNIVATGVADDPDRARVRSKWFSPYTRASHVPVRWAGGEYRDTVMRTADGWKFAAKVCIGHWQYTPDGQEPLPEHRRTY